MTNRFFGEVKFSVFGWFPWFSLWFYSLFWSRWVPHCLPSGKRKQRRQEKTRKGSKTPKAKTKMRQFCGATPARGNGSGMRKGRRKSKGHSTSTRMSVFMLFQQRPTTLHFPGLVCEIGFHLFCAGFWKRWFFIGFSMVTIRLSWFLLVS